MSAEVVGNSKGNTSNSDVSPGRSTEKGETKSAGMESQTSAFKTNFRQYSAASHAAWLKREQRRRETRNFQECLSRTKCVTFKHDEGIPAEVQKAQEEGDSVLISVIPDKDGFKSAFISRKK
ncbi:hypothetical protein O0L34_g9983 [Tuta absoluta]|nr:hypothetical protein O0L34_g9983 [Tuta absoluta]